MSKRSPARGGVGARRPQRERMMPHPDASLSMSLADFQLDAVGERFFSQAPTDSDALDVVATGARMAGTSVPGTTVSATATMTRTQRRAMLATFGMLLVFVVSLVAFLVYSHVIMPQPAELSAERGMGLETLAPQP